jgi:multidrug efflux pump subunit AcrB
VVFVPGGAMFWTIGVWCFWAGVLVSFLFTCVVSVWQFTRDDLSFDQKVGQATGSWLRWLLSVAGGLVVLVVIGFLLSLLGFNVHGIIFEPR